MAEAQPQKNRVLPVGPGLPYPAAGAEPVEGSPEATRALASHTLLLTTPGILPP